MKIPMGLIKLDSPFAKEIGFTSDKFNYSHLWGSKEGITLSTIRSNVKGSFANMIKILEANDIIFRIPSPSVRMREIGEKQGWRFGSCDDGSGDTVIFLTNKKEARDD